MVVVDFSDPPGRYRRDQLKEQQNQICFKIQKDPLGFVDSGHSGGADELLFVLSSDSG